MTHQVTVELADEVYRALVERAQATGQTVEAVALACVAESLRRPAPGSRLRRWAGALDSGLPDVATRHHDYLGQALYDELQGKKDA